jgi:organic hydroperoxide reductase OsmC/OhrA
MTAPFPHRYEAGLRWEGQEGAVIHAQPRPLIVGGAPPEFGGRESWWSPEHLLLSSLNLCLMATFKSLAERARLSVANYSSRAEGVLDKTEAGLGFTSVTLHVEMAVDPAQVETADRLLLAAKKHCIVANSLKAPVGLMSRVQAAVPTA